MTKGAIGMKCEVLVDWLNFTVKDVGDPQRIIREYLGMDPALFQDPGYGWLGYQKVLEFSNIRVAYEPRENTYFHDMGICVSMSGNGCRTFEKLSRLTHDGASDDQGMKSIAFSVLFQKLAAGPNCNVSRIDIACDDKDSALDMDVMVAQARSGGINTRLQRGRLVEDLMNGESSGKTIYLGAPSSDFRVRIYDKAAEQGVDGHWVRVELVFRAQNANAFVDELIHTETVGKLAAQVLNDKLRFIERDDSNISRCSVCDWWQDFVDELESVHLVSREVVQHAVEEISDWMEHQIGPSISIILQTMGYGRLWEIAHTAQLRLSSKQEALIKDYNSLRRSRPAV